jgi:seryl-tRNA synthetase
VSIAAGVAPHAFRDLLFQRGLLVGTGVPGVYGRSLEFEDTVDRIDAAVAALGAADGARVLRFPPILNRAHFERSGYLESFPHLAGAIHSFAGDDHAHRTLLHSVANGADWSRAWRPAEVVLTPAACYPVYPTLAGTLPEGGSLVDVMSYCFRHEPSDDVARMQMFRMHEHVRAGDAATVMAWREIWLERAQAFAQSLGLEWRSQVASDQFFGRTGKLLASGQRQQKLKLEIVAPIASDEAPTAIVSLNDHRDHFGELFGIAASDGSVAHTSCIGFGLERIALALYRRHGLDRAHWPGPVRDVLTLRGSGGSDRAA